MTVPVARVKFKYGALLFLIWSLLTCGLAWRPARAQTRAPMTATLNNGNLVNLRAHRISHSANKTIAEGDVVVQTEGAQIEAQYVVLDHLTNQIHARGSVRMFQAGDEINAQSATYDLDTRFARLTDVFGIARNLSFRQEPLHGEMYFWSPSATWDGQVIRLKKGVVTTCDIPPPRYHFHMSGDEVVIYPKDRIEIHKLGLYLGKKQVVGKKTLVLSLKDDRGQQDLIPRVGVTQTDGVFVKETLHYLAGKRDWGVVHLDYFQKAGLAYGLEHNYHLGNKGDGILYFYDLPTAPGRLGRFELRDSTTYHFAPTFTGQLNFSSTRYLSPVNAVQTPTNTWYAVSLTNSGQRSVEALSTAFFSSGSIHNESYATLYNVSLSERLSNHFEAQYIRAASAVSSSFYLHSLDRLTYLGDLFDSDLIFEQTTGSKLFLVNRRPEVQLRSRDLRLGPVPLQVALGVGQIDEQPSGASSGRTDVQVTVPDVSYPVGSHGNIRAGLGLRQLFYTTGDAQYLGIARASWTQEIGENVRSYVDYRYQRARGFTPLQSDFFGRYHAVSAGVQVTDYDKVRFGVDLGRDIDFGRYYNLQARLDLTPWQRWKLNVGSSFDPNTGHPLNVDTQIRVPLSNTLSLQHYTLYDVQNRRLTYQDFMVQDDGHDWVTSVIYRSVQKEFYVQIALKALPYEQPTVGPNTRSPVLPIHQNRGMFF